MNAELFYEKDEFCPICEARFSPWILKGKAYRRVGGDTDFRPRYEGANPLFYAVWACPNCGYAALEGDFHKLEARAKRETAELLWGRLRAGRASDGIPYPRTLSAAVAAHERALELYGLRRTAAIKQAVVLHRLAWLHRIDKNEPRERGRLEQAVEKYLETYYAGGPFLKKLGELGTMFLIGELKGRLGVVDEAVKWFRLTLGHELIQGMPFVKRLVRDGLYRHGAGEEEPEPEAPGVMDYDVPLEEVDAGTG